MKHELVHFTFPAEFILRWALPTGPELAYGFRHGFITRGDVVVIALQKYKAGLPLSWPEEELMLLLADDYDKADDLIRQLEISDESSEQRARLWLLLSLAWLREHREAFADPLEVIEMLYADFEYPDEIRNLVRFMPPQAGEATGVNAIEDRWRQYLELTAAEYRERDERAGS